MSDKTKVMASGGISEAGQGHKPVLVVAGPTASGKSALAARLARDFGGIVINADSMQVYRDLPILTAQPSEAAKAAAPHRLYGFLALDDVCSADRWATLARQEIDAAHDAGKLPILCGGTGLYLRALMQGFSPIPEVPADVRQAARDLLEEIGSAALRERLAAGDPASAARLHANDRQRIARAWEVLQATGRPISEWQTLPPVAPGDLRFQTFVLLPERTALYRACDEPLPGDAGRGRPRGGAQGARPLSRTSTARIGRRPRGAPRRSVSGGWHGTPGRARRCRRTRLLRRSSRPGTTPSGREPGSAIRCQMRIL